MRLATVIGRVTLSDRHPAFRGERLLLVRPWTAATLARGEPPGKAIVAYDNLGAGVGQIVGLSEGSEASKPFTPPLPVDCTVAALIDTVTHLPPPAPQPDARA